MDLRLVPVAAAAWATSLAVGAGHVRGALIAVAALLLVSLVWRAAAPRATEGVVPSALLVCVAALAAGLTASAAAVTTIPWTQVTEVEVEGVVVESAPRGARAASVLVEVERWREVEAWDADWRPGDGRVRALVEGDPPAWGEHTVIRGTRWEEAAAPVLVDAEASRSPPTGWRGSVARVREDFAQLAAPLPPAREALVMGMAIGDDAAMPDDLDLALQVSGLAHLTAVSGAHFAIVMGAVLGVFALARAPRWMRAGAVLLTCAALAAVVTGGGSVTRALAMACVAALALGLGRRHRPLPTLAAGVVVLVILDPGIARDLGFALSVAAVAGIATLTMPLARRLTWLAPWIAQAVAVTVAAQVATLPLLVGWAAELGPWAVAANAVAAPFAVPATLAGVGAVACASWWPGAGALLVEVAALATMPIELAARTFSAVPGAGVRWRDGAPGIVLAFLLVVAVAAAVAVPARRGRRAGWVAAAAISLAATAPAAWVPPLLGGPARGWEVLACDVGQGDALVVRAGGAAVMIDTGEDDGLARDCLRAHGVAHLDLLILTHAHADHMGGLVQVAEASRIARVWLPPGIAAHTRDAAAGTGAVLEEPVVGAALSAGGISVEVLQVGPAPASRYGAEVNDSSIVVGLAVEGMQVLALGDLELDGQARLREALGSPQWRHWRDAHVLKVAHHGSAVQDAALLAELRPRVALVSVGRGNEYGHPNPGVLATLARAGATVLRTDQCGHIALAAAHGEPRLVSRCQTNVGG